MTLLPIHVRAHGSAARVNSHAQEQMAMQKGLCSRLAIPSWKMEPLIQGRAFSPSHRIFRTDIFKVSSQHSECKMVTVSDRSLTVKVAPRIVMFPSVWIIRRAQIQSRVLGVHSRSVRDMRVNFFRRML